LLGQLLMGQHVRAMDDKRRQVNHFAQGAGLFEGNKKFANRKTIVLPPA